MSDGGAALTAAGPADAIAQMTRPKRSVADVEVGGRRVLVRVDFNVPMDGTRIVDDRRIRAALPTLRLLRERGARVIVATHLGRPGGRCVAALSTAPLAARLSELLGTQVRLADDVAGEGARALASSLADGEVGMLENLRFEAGEEADDDSLSTRLAALADVYVDEAFGAAHRAHASVHGIAHHLDACAGLLMARELEMLGRVLRDPARPLVAIIGGSKISSKLAVVRSLLERVDTLWIGGAMACTFFKALGEEVGNSLVEDDQLEVASALLRDASTQRADLRLPVDVVVAPSTHAGARTQTVAWKAIPDDEAVVDVGADTVRAIDADCQSAATVVWNGPLGIYEVDAFAAGTRAVANALASSQALSVVGGGDLAAALDAAGVADAITHVSTGGGATLELLEGRLLPGVAVIRDS